jgi:hypothetical protein
MKKIEKLTSMKTIVVYLTSDNVCEFEINPDIFDDPFMEAATRAIEKSKQQRGAIIRPITTCWEKDLPKRVHMYNSYWILVNAARYSKAEQLRDKFRIQYDADLAKEPVHGKLTKS